MLSINVHMSCSKTYNIIVMFLIYLKKEMFIFTDNDMI